MNFQNLDPNRFIFDLSIDMPETKRTPEPTRGVFIGELIINDGTDLTLRVYFGNNKAPRGIMSFVGNHEYTLLSRFTVTKIHNPDHLLEIDFADYNYIGMQSNTAFFDPVLNLRYFTIKLGGVRLKFKSRGEPDSKIYLNDTATKLAELYYDYSSNYPWAEKFVWEPSNRLVCMQFGNIQFLLEHNFYQDGKKSAKDVVIKKEPRIRFKQSDLSYEEIVKHRDLLCALFSFYTNKRIDWTVSRIVSGDYLYVERRKISSEPVDIIHGLFIWDFIQNPMNLVLNVSGEKLLGKVLTIVSLIERFNYSLHAPDETKFMILYSVLEQVRNEYILDGLIEQDKAGNPPDLKKVKEEFVFNVSNAEANSAIRSALETLIPKIDAAEQDKFKAELSGKISFIKMNTMTDQFESLFMHLGIDPGKFDLDFKTLKQLRDHIFHGKLLDPEKISYLKKATWYSSLPKLTGVVMLKYFGIADLATIPKTRLR